MVDVRLAEGADWIPAVPGVTVLARNNGLLRLSASSEIDPQSLLAAAECQGHVTAFSYGPPSLADTFLDVVTQ